MNVLRFLGVSAAGAVLAMAVASPAAPIRVGVFKGVGPNKFWHEMIHTASNVMGNILANPNDANLGHDLLVYPDGFLYAQFGKVTGSGSPSASETAAFIAALDTLDVVVFLTQSSIDDIITNSLSRERLAEFWKRKGVVSIHGTTDTRGQWPAWDSLHGTRFLGHPVSDRQGTLKLDAVSHAEPAWKLLNRSLFDTAFVEEWHFFMNSGIEIRATPGLKVTINLDESTLVGGFGGRTAMGDHPMSWYREFAEGGRFFFTAVGHRPNLWNTAANQPRFLRRQVYNAILWAAGVDSTGAVSVRGRPPVREFSEAARISFSGSSLNVSVQKDGPHAVEVRSLDGRIVAARRGEGRAVHEFAGLRSDAVYAVSVTVGGQRLTRMAVMK